jgi:hypothetical protein
MPEITPYGYSYIRDRIYEGWRYVQLNDENGDKITRVSTDDYRFNINYVEGSSILKLELALEGSNHDIPIPSTLSEIELYEDFESEDILARVDIDPNIKIESSNDIIEIDQYIEVPRITF